MTGVIKKVLLSFFIMMTLACNVVFAQNQEKWNYGEYTRGSGFVVRPEMYSGFFATIGYQINPFVQISGGIGFGLDGGFGTTLGLRTYTSDTPWSAIFDYHIGLVNIMGVGLIRHTIVGGVSYKDFDIGAGLLYLTDGYDSGIGLSITLGYNIRCYEHR